MTKIIIDKYKYGSAKFCDCLDEEQGMPSLKDDAFNLGFTDPPWGVDIHKRIHTKRKYHTSMLKVSDKLYYKDIFDPEWNLSWFNQLKRVTKYQILVVSEKYKYWWVRNTDPIGDITIQWINGYSSSKVSIYNRKSTYLVYAKKLENKLKYNLISIVIPDQLLKWGFLSTWKGKHPTPKGVEIPLILYKQLKPKSVLDPFLGCYDSKTEILTEKGWKFFKDLTYNDKIATLDKNHNLYYTKPLVIQNYHYKGEMIKINHRSVDLLVTPNHNLYLREYHKKNYEFFKANEVKYKWVRTLNSVNWQGKERKYFYPPKLNETINSHNIYNKFLMDDWLEFLGWYIAEGWSQKRSEKHRNYIIYIAQSKNLIKVNEIKNLLIRMNFKWKYVRGRFLFESKQLWKYLKQLGKAWEKYIPQEFMNLSKRQLKILFSSLIKGDGYISKSKEISYYTTSKKLADQIQELAIKIGYNSTLRIRKKRKKYGKINGREIISKRKQYNIGIRRAKECKLDSWKHINYDEKNYNGIVYCCTVPEHIILVRRNGKPVWCGNSGSYGQACEMLKIPWTGYEINEIYRDDIKLRMSSVNTTKSGVKYWLE